MRRLLDIRKAKSFVTISVVCLLLYFAFKYLRPKLLEKHQHGENNRSSNCTTRDFQVIEQDLAYAYSAYIDDRPATDCASIGLPVVRIFVYFDRKIDPRAKWRCRLSYEDSSRVDVTNVGAITDLDAFDVNRRFMPAMALCVLPEPGHLKLHGVSLVSESAQDIGNYICVEDLRLRRDRRWFPNETGRLASQPSNRQYSKFTICVRVIYNDYYKAQDIVNFIEVNRLLGVDKFVFYADAETANFSSIRCLEYYSRLGIVEIYPFTPPVPDEDSLLCRGQIITLNECPYRVMYRTEFVVNIDLDEFIVPTNASSLTQMFNDFQRKRPYSERSIASYSFRNQFFPTQVDDDPFFSNDATVEQYGIKTLLKTMKEDYIYEHHRRSKVIGRPERILVWHTHMVLPWNLINRRDFISFVEKSDALLYHYRQWSDGQNLIRDRRMHAYAAQLTQSIPSRLRSCQHRRRKTIKSTPARLLYSTSGALGLEVPN